MKRLGRRRQPLRARPDRLPHRRQAAMSQQKKRKKKPLTPQDLAGRDTSRFATPFEAVRPVTEAERTRRFLAENEARWAKVETPPGLETAMDRLRAQGFNVENGASLADGYWSLDGLGDSELRALFRVSGDRTHFERMATEGWVEDPNLLRRWVNPDVANDVVPIDRATAEEIATRVWGVELD